MANEFGDRKSISFQTAIFQHGHRSDFMFSVEAYIYCIILGCFRLRLAMFVGKS